MSNLRRIIQNSLWLYLKILINAFVGLYTTRVFLKALGVDNYGIFGLIAGIIAMILVINTAMVTSSQRYMSLSKGKDNDIKQKEVFASVFILHLITSIIVLVVLLSFKNLIILKILKFPSDKISVVNIAYFVMIATTSFSILSVPFNAIIASNEDMHISVLVEMSGSFFKLISAIFVSKYFVDESEAMLFYMGVLILHSLIILIPQIIISNKKYSEVNFNLKTNGSFSLVLEMFHFGKWNLLGITAGVFRNQSMNIAINNFFPLSYNTSFNIANQLNAQIMNFSQSTIKSVTPQIVKNYGAGNIGKSIYMAELTSKLSFSILSYIAIPFIFLAPEILTLWLGEFPEYTIVFLRLVLVLSLFVQLGIGLQIAIQASGHIKLYQTVAGCLGFLSLPVAFILLKYGSPAYTVILVPLVIEIVLSTYRLFYSKRFLKVNFLHYLKNVYVKCIIYTCSISMIINTITKINLNFISKIVIVSVIVLILNSLFIYIIILNSEEKKVVKHKIRSTLNRF